MIVLSYFTRDFFKELIENDLNEKIIEHFVSIIRNKNFFFIGHKKIYEDLIKKNENKIIFNHKKLNLIKSIFKSSEWVNLPFNTENIQNLFNYLNNKRLNLDFIFASNNESTKKIGDIKKLKKETLEKVISPERIIKENMRLLDRYNKISNSTHQIEYKPRQKLEKVKLTRSFMKWYENINKIIFVSEKILVYDKYIAKNLIEDDAPKSPFNSKDYFLTLEYLSKIIENSFIGKKNFYCDIVCVFEKRPKIHQSKIDSGINKDIKWDFFKNEVGNYLDKLKSINRKIDIKDWKMWNLVHDRYIKFYRGSSLIKTIKLDPGFDFIKFQNIDPYKEKLYEFDHVEMQTAYKKEGKFKKLLDEKSAFLMEKSA